VQESEGKEDTPMRRNSDFTDAGQQPTVQDAWQRSGVANKRISLLEADIEKIKRAFLKDDLGTFDADGHRRDHLEIKESAKLVREYKVGMTKDLLKTVGSVAFGALVVGLMNYLPNHIK
jgi:hypothetical protein